MITKLKSGTVYVMGEPFVGKMPVRQDLTVLPADGTPVCWSEDHRSYRGNETMDDLDKRNCRHPDCQVAVVYDS